MVLFANEVWIKSISLRGLSGDEDELMNWFAKARGGEVSKWLGAELRVGHDAEHKSDATKSRKTKGTYVEDGGG